MKLIDKVTYKEIEQPKGVIDVDKVIMPLTNAQSKQTSFFFEIDETDHYVVFAMLYLLQGIEDGEKVFFWQLETATLQKKTLFMYSHQDNEGFESYAFLNNRPVWTMETLAKHGIKDMGDAPVDYPHKHVQWDIIKEAY